MLRPSTMPVTSSIRSASVDLPWSMWAMMQKFRMRAGSVLAGVVTVPPSSHGTRLGPGDRRKPPCGRSRRTAGWGPADDAGILADRSAGALRPDALSEVLPPARHRGSRVANIKSQIKRIKTNEKARQRNVAVQVRP